MYRSAHIGFTQKFVLGQGFREISNYWALVCRDGSLRLLAEISADPDHSEVRPREAYQAMLASMQPGWIVRLLQVFWPDPLPRQAFLQQAGNWTKPKSEGLELLKLGIVLYLQQAPLPFLRRTILEYCFPGDEGLAWWKGLPGLFLNYGLRLYPLAAADIQELARRICNPDLRQ